MIGVLAGGVTGRSDTIGAKLLDIVTGCKEVTLARLLDPGRAMGGDGGPDDIETEENSLWAFDT